MKLSFYNYLSILPLLVVSSEAASTTDIQQDIQFLTVLVGDFKSNGRSYVDFIRTAQNVPPELTLLALQIQTYTDNAYTTMLNNPNLNVASLRSFATGLPWYTRIELELNAAGVASTKASGSTSSSKALDSSSSKAGANFVQYTPHGAVLGIAALLLL